MKLIPKMAVGKWIGRLVKRQHAGAVEDLPDIEDDRGLGPETAKYLDERAFASFVRETATETAIWQSLPIFTGALVAAAALDSSIGGTLPTLAPSMFPIVVRLAFIASIVAFAVSGVCLCLMLWPRDFAIPADDRMMQEYAVGNIPFHMRKGLRREALDRAVLADVRAAMTAGFSEAAASAMRINGRRLVWRWRLLVSLISGFALAFASDGLILGKRLVGDFAVMGVTAMSTETKAPPKADHGPSHSDRPKPPPMRNFRDGGWTSKAGLSDNKGKK